MTPLMARELSFVQGNSVDKAKAQGWRLNKPIESCVYLGGDGRPIRS